jgi:Fe2+ transport system protein FeoA
MSRGCDMVRCPRCGYEFVESGRILDMLRRWIRRGPAPRGETFRLIDLQPGETGSIISIPHHSLARVSRLASFGIVAGTEVRLIARLPTVVLECGSTQIESSRRSGGKFSSAHPSNPSQEGEDSHGRPEKGCGLLPGVSDQQRGE